MMRVKLQYICPISQGSDKAQFTMSGKNGCKLSVQQPAAAHLGSHLLQRNISGTNLKEVTTALEQISVDQRMVLVTAAAALTLLAAVRGEPWGREC